MTLYCWKSTFLNSKKFLKIKVKGLSQQTMPGNSKVGVIRTRMWKFWYLIALSRLSDNVSLFCSLDVHHSPSCLPSVRWGHIVWSPRNDNMNLEIRLNSFEFNLSLLFQLAFFQVFCNRGVKELLYSFIALIYLYRSNFVISISDKPKNCWTCISTV